MLSNKTNYKGVSQCLIQFGVKPEWKILCRTMKKLLLKKLGEKKYKNIHDPRFYQDLENEWQLSKDFFADVILHEHANVECAICMEKYKVTDKVTTLMCGHKFCSSCILQHILAHGSNTQCPLCRASVFALDDAPPITVDQHTNSLPVSHTMSRSVTDEMVDAEVQRKREKRRLERLKKRQLKKNK